LKTDDLNQLCLSCHDGVPGIPDVVAGDSNGLRERSAGFFSMAGSGDARGHDLDEQMTCVTCHDPHGNGQPRNLRLPSDPESAAHLGLVVRESATRLRRYERENVAYGTLDSPELREVSALCLDCHGKLKGDHTKLLDGNVTYTMHPSYDSQGGAANLISQGSTHRSTDPSYWNFGQGPEFDTVGRVPFVTTGAATFAAAAMVDAGRNGVFCLSCHKAHGSEHTFALRWEQNGPADQTGCNQCHAKGKSRSRELLTSVETTRR
jgi:hypothetical protein